MNCVRIDTKDRNGELTTTGVEWTEGRNGLFYLKVVGVVGLFGITVACLLGTLFSHQWMLLLGIAAAAATLGVVLMLEPMPGTARRLVFSRDGSIHAPLGLSYYRKSVKRLGSTIADVASFERIQLVRGGEDEGTPFTHGVVLYKRDGGMTYVASNLHPDDAHKVSVQLTLAHFDLKKDMAIGVRGRWSPPGTSGAPMASVDVVIN